MDSIPLPIQRMRPDQRCRSTYTAKSADRWKPTLQAILASLADKEEEFISATDVGRSSTTIHIGCNDCLLWLLDNGSQNDRQWALTFKSRISMRKEPSGVRFIRKAVPRVVVTSEPPPTDRSLKDEVLEWYSEAEDGAILERANVSITQDLEDFLLKLISRNPNGEVELNKEMFKFRVMK